MGEIKRMVWDTIIVLSFLFLVWIGVSWADVLVCQSTGQTHQWNAFVLLTEVEV